MPWSPSAIRVSYSQAEPQPMLRDLLCRSHFAWEERIPLPQFTRERQSRGIPPPRQRAIIRTVSVRDQGGSETQVFQDMVTERPHDFLWIPIKGADFEAREQQLLLQQVTPCFRRDKPAVIRSGRDTEPGIEPGFGKLPAVSMGQRVIREDGCVESVSAAGSPLPVFQFHGPQPVQADV